MRVTTKPWACQLVYAERIDKGVVLDLIALESCPIPHLELAVGDPFVIRVLADGGQDCCGVVDAWADDAVVVEIRLVDAPSGRWLWVSARAGHLILEMTG